MNARKAVCMRLKLLAVTLLVTAAQYSYAHEYSNLNEIMIDRTNDSIANSIIQVQSFLTDIFRQRYKPETWPDTKLTVLRNDLMHQKEEANMSLDYFVAKGINIQSPEVLFDNPLAGRAVAASQGIETAFALLKHVNTLESQDLFIKEIYSSGMSAYMYNLITAYREKMDLYKSIFINVPGPGQQTAAPVSAVQVNEPPSNMPYILALVIAGMIIIGLLFRKKA